MDYEVIAIAYASIISTMAFGLEIRRWVEEGARLRIDVSLPMKTYNVPGAEGKKYLCVTATNVGKVPTTITGMIVCDFANCYKKALRHPREGGSILNPALPGQPFVLPKLLKPGELWQGFAILDEKLESWVAKETVYAGVFASHSKKMIIERAQLGQSSNHN